MMGLLLTWCIK